jgi:hypothetical protein
MMEDIERIKDETKHEKIVTKHEWMIAALQVLEEKQGEDDSQLKQLYESLFIDPSKLTPYQQ